MASTITFINDAETFYFAKDPIFPYSWVTKETLYWDFTNRGFHQYFKIRPPENTFTLEFTGIPESNYNEFLQFLRHTSVRFSQYCFIYNTFYGETKSVRYVSHTGEFYMGKMCSEDPVQVLYDLTIILRDET